MGGRETKGTALRKLRRWILSIWAAAPINLHFRAHPMHIKRNTSPEHPVCILTAAVPNQSPLPTLTGSLFKPAILSQSGTCVTGQFLACSQTVLLKSADCNLCDEVELPVHQRKRTAPKGYALKRCSKSQDLSHDPDMIP